MINKIKSRFSGHIQRCLWNATKDLIKKRNRFSFSIFKYYLIWYIQGGERAYDLLKKRYCKDNVFDFGFIKLPHVEVGKKNFVSEYHDLIFPYLYPGECLWAQREGTYEQFGVNVKSGDVICDVGANIGMFSGYASNKGANVFAFEPNQDVIPILEKTISINNGEISIIPLALMDSTQAVEMSYDAENLGSANLNADYLRGSHIVKIQVEGITLDQWVENNSIQRIDFIKADIEGAERLLLKGAEGVLKKFKPRLAICTYHYPEDPEILEGIILKANPEYKVYQGAKKLFAV